MKKSSRMKTSVANAATASSAVTRKATGRHTNSPDVSPLLECIVSILDGARARVVRSVSSKMVLAYWHIGREIVEPHQGGAVRAEYGGQILDVLSGLDGFSDQLSWSHFAGGKKFDGIRWNDLHYSRTAKLAARGRAKRGKL